MTSFPRREDRRIVTAQVGEVPVARLGDAWPRPRVDPELAAMLSRRLGELSFLGADLTPFDQVLGRRLARPAECRVTEAVAGHRARPPGDIADVRKALAGCGAPDAVERRITGLAVQAQEVITARADLPGDAAQPG